MERHQWLAKRKASAVTSMVKAVSDMEAPAVDGRG
jgi:hypothetical protein